MKTIARMRDEALMTKLLEQESDDVLARARRGSVNYFFTVTLLCAAAAVLASLSGCATAPQVRCYVPIASSPSNDQRELDAAACTASTITVDQNIACMRIRGYRVQVCNADGSIAEQWVSLR